MCKTGVGGRFLFFSPGNLCKGRDGYQKGGILNGLPNLVHFVELTSLRFTRVSFFFFFSR